MRELNTIENRMLRQISNFECYGEDARMDSGHFMVFLDDLKAVILDVPQCVDVLEIIASNKKQAKAERKNVIEMIITTFALAIPFDIKSKQSPWGVS